MRERRHSVQRQMRENGVTYNVYADPQGADRPWELDLLPLILPQEEWARHRGGGRAARGAAQPRSWPTSTASSACCTKGCCRRRWSSATPASCGRATASSRPATCMLHVYAADLARSPDGRWWVLADRTQAPSGAGYALENRIVISRAFPSCSASSTCSTSRSFFATLRDSLAHWAPHGRRRAPAHRAAHARAVQRDLLRARVPRALPRLPAGRGRRPHRARRPRLPEDAVRACSACTRSCAGSTTTTAIRSSCAATRRSASRASSTRCAAATCWSPTRSARACSSRGALLGFLPALCRAAARREAADAVGRHLVVRRAGGARGRDRARSTELVIKPAFPQLRVEPCSARTSTSAARKRVDRHAARAAARLRRAGAGAPLAGAGAGTARTRALLARAIGLRVFACATPNGYVVMPGGLTRVASAADARVVSMQRGGVEQGHLGARRRPGQHLQPAAPRDRAAGPGARRHATCRAAWSRTCSGSAATAERCDDVGAPAARRARPLVDDVPADDDERALAGASSSCCAAPASLPAQRPSPRRRASWSRALRAAIADDARPGLASGCAQLLRVASHLRERLSLDNWRALNRMTQRLAPSAAGARSTLLRRCSASSTRDRRVHDAVGLRARRHDARPRLALPVASAGASSACSTLCAVAAAGARRAAAERDLDWLLRAGRHDHHLPRALHGRARVAAGARPAGARRGQPALDRVPAATACTTTCSSSPTLVGDCGDEQLRRALTQACSALDPAADLRHGQRAARWTLLDELARRRATGCREQLEPALLQPRRRSRAAQTLRRPDAAHACDRIVHETHVHATPSPVVAVAAAAAPDAARAAAGSSCDLAPHRASTPAAGESGERDDYFGNRTVHCSARRAARRAAGARRARRSSVAPRAAAGARGRRRLGGGARRGCARSAARAAEPRSSCFESPHVEPLGASSPPTRRRASRAGAAAARGGARPRCAASTRTSRSTRSATSVSTPLREVLQARRGVCQDFAHLMIGCLRSLGLPARYVSGYLLTAAAARDGRAWSAPTPRTPGSRSACRDAPAGSTSIRPTTASSTTSTSRWLGPRLRRRHADARRDPRRRRAGARGARHRHAARASASIESAHG